MPPCTISWQVTCPPAGGALVVSFSTNGTTANVTSGLGPSFSIDMSPPAANRACVAELTVSDEGHVSTTTVNFEVSGRPCGARANGNCTCLQR